MSRAKTLAPWAKGAQNGDKKGGVGVFCNRYNELIFLCNGTDQYEIRAKNVYLILVE